MEESMKNRVFIAFLLFFCVIAAFADDKDFDVILGGQNNNVEEGFTYNGTFHQIAFINPSLHSGNIVGGDFAIMQRRDVNNRHTLDEDEAKVRLFFKPEIRVKSLGRRSRMIHGAEKWKLVKKDRGVAYSRIYANAAGSMKSSINVQSDPVRAQLYVEVKLENIGFSDCQVEFSPVTTFLRNDVQPFNVVMPRSLIRYTDGKRTYIMFNEKTLLNSNWRNYWWRTAAKDCRDFLNAFNRERIPFNHPRLLAPDKFALTGLVGKSALIWDLEESFKNNEKLAALELSWDAGRGDAVTNWSVNLKRGEKKTIRYRIITLRGLNSFADIRGDWVLGYSINESCDLLQIQAVPVLPQDKHSVAATVNDSRNNQVLVNQSSEVAAMSPFTPCKLEWRPDSLFQHGVVYVIRMKLSSVEGKGIFEQLANIVP